MILHRSATEMKKLFWFAFILSLLVKSLLAIWLPLTGDEAYYIMWGKYPALGYYDHPPVIGWITAILHGLGSSVLWMRLPALLAPLVMAWYLVKLLRVEHSEEQAYLCGSLFLLVPYQFFIPLLSTDTSLVFFSFFCFYSFSHAIREKAFSSAVLSGMFLGLAFLSKYFAALLGVSFFLYVLGFRKSKFNWMALGGLILGFIPFLVLHLHWNSKNCWINFYFHLFSRSQAQSVHPHSFLEWAIMQLYLLGPLLVLLFVALKRIFKSKKLPAQSALAWITFGFPLLCFAGLSLQVAPGLHWFLSFYPFLYIGLALVLSAREIRRVLPWVFSFLGIHALVVFALILTPLETWRDQKFYRGLQLYFDTPALRQEVEKYAHSGFIAADDYTTSALLEAQSSLRVHVFGLGSAFGRQDDFISLLKDFDQRDGLIVSRHNHSVEEYQPYFQSLRKEALQMGDRAYYLYFGKQFSFETYQRQVLQGVRQRYYQIPSFFPTQACPVMDQYF